MNTVTITRPRKLVELLPKYWIADIILESFQDEEAFKLGKKDIPPLYRELSDRMMRAWLDALDRESRGSILSVALNDDLLPEVTKPIFRVEGEPTHTKYYDHIEYTMQSYLSASWFRKVWVAFCKHVTTTYDEVKLEIASRKITVRCGAMGWYIEPRENA